MCRRSEFSLCLYFYLLFHGKAIILNFVKHAAAYGPRHDYERMRKLFSFYLVGVIILLFRIGVSGNRQFFEHSLKSFLGVCLEMQTSRETLLWVLCVLGACLFAVSLAAAWPLWVCAIGGALCLAPLLYIALRRGRQLEEARQKVHALEKELELQRTTAQAEQAQLQQELRDRMEGFRSLLSHDLRMPISIIQGYIELLADGMVTDPNVQKEYLRKVLQRTRYMNDILTRQLLEARREEDRAPACAQLELLSLSRQICQDMSTAAACRGISIQVISAETEVFVFADRYQMSKIFFNLVENAIKYMGREGMITICITRNDSMAQVVVQDDGLGLDSQETDHIFELDFQGSNRVPGQGHGHGLYLVKRAVESQGGSISASSHPGCGMTLRFTLPLADAGAPAAGS